jgi:hypothetical protein
MRPACSSRSAESGKPAISLCKGPIRDVLADIGVQERLTEKILDFARQAGSLPLLAGQEVQSHD